MDEIVRAAIAKWPNVPHCYGWLALDARGNWRMRDERCQALNLQGDIIRHPVLLDFIHRNYQHDQEGQWYFQNGPQRVYVDLEATPYIARTSVDGMQLHTGQSMTLPDETYLTTDGHILFQLGSSPVLAQLDDRDISQVLGCFYVANKVLSDEELLHIMSGTVHTVSVSLRLPAWPEQSIPVRIAELEQLKTTCRFVARPR